MNSNTSTYHITQSEYPEGAIIAQGWQPVKPLQAVMHNPNPYPVESFPAVAKGAILSYQDYANAPLAMIGTSALSYMAIACQANANVARDDHLISPLSLITLTIASSGERKTSCDSAFGKAVHEFEKAKTLTQKEEYAANKASRDAKEAERKAITAQMRGKNGVGADIAAKVEYELLELERKTPEAMPEIFQMLYADTNQQALLYNLNIQHPSAGLFCDEAAIVIGGNGMNDDNAIQFFGVLNILWDGKTYKRNRIVAPSVVLRDKRLTSSLMMQPSVFTELLNIKDGQTRGTGFLARFVITRPESTIGTRFYKASFDQHYMDAFHHRITELISQPLPYNTEQDAENRWLTPPALHLSEAAKQYWIASYNDIEKASSATATYGELQDFASKAADNAARIAANFHLFDGGNVHDTISEKHMQDAVKLVLWYLEEAKLILQASKAEEQFKKAQQVLEWIVAKQSNGIITSKTLLQNITPVIYPQKATIEPILQLLIEHHYVKPCMSGKKQYVLHPDYCGGE